MVTPMTGQYRDQNGNELRHRGNQRGSGMSNLHPDNHVESYRFGRHSDRYRDRFNGNGRSGGGGTHT